MCGASAAGQFLLSLGESDAAALPLDGELKRNATASFGAITLGGEPQSLDQLGELEIPGLAKIQTGLKKKLKDGIRIVGVRVTLLDGTGAVLDFATSKLSIRES